MTTKSVKRVSIRIKIVSLQDKTYIEMTPIRHIVSILGLTVLFIGIGHTRVEAQSPCGPSDPSEPMDCGVYQWPLVQSPCPEVQIMQKHNHTPLKQYRVNGWDTVVTCIEHQIELSCMPYIPVQYFNGQYTVDTIPFDPPDPTFAGGTKMPVNTDDDFAAAATAIPFPFHFFGIQKNFFVLGANGLITFNTSTAGKYCPWRFSANLPWTNTKTGVPGAMGCTTAEMRDAIYGIYEDTHPVAAYLHGDQGIYYGIQGEEPCRKIIASWNGIPTFPGTRNLDNRCTYQIVCYEGSNIIEVHVKRRGVNTNWQNGMGILGIQNATGNLQQPDTIPTSPLVYIAPNSPAAFYPEGLNKFNTTLDTIAFRFTPQGYSYPATNWYRIFDDGTPDYPLTQDPNDPNGYCEKMQQDLANPDFPNCPRLTRAWVTPTETSRYAFRITYIDASGVQRTIGDTITIGMDTAHRMTLRPAEGTPSDTSMVICSGTTAKLMIEYPPLQDTVSTTVLIRRLNGGANTQLPDSLLVLGEMYEDEVAGLKRIPALFYPDNTALHVQPGHIDSILIQYTALFVSGCQQTKYFLLRTFPAYDTILYDTICEGETYHWDVDGRDYRQSTTSPRVTLPTSVADCDSVVHLHLKVAPASFTVDRINDCKPVTWQNGRTYTESNDATRDEDVVHLENAAHCDSTVQLWLDIFPMTTRIGSSLEYFDLDHFEVELTDLSVNGARRTWIFPNGETATTATTYYTIPLSDDEATIKMVEYSEHGCVDTAYITLPFRKDVIWVPNTFTPENPGNSDRNGTFGSVSRHLLTQETLIYNRRGEMVFRSHEVDGQWDGRDLKGDPCQTGAYVYIIRYTTDYEPNVTRTVKGSVTLLR